jgi:hypothetical protein
MIDDFYCAIKIGALQAYLALSIIFELCEQEQTVGCKAVKARSATTYLQPTVKILLRDFAL